MGLLTRCRGKEYLASPGSRGTRLLPTLNVGGDSYSRLLTGSRGRRSRTAVGMSMSWGEEGIVSGEARVQTGDGDRDPPPRTQFHHSDAVGVIGLNSRAPLNLGWVTESLVTQRRNLFRLTPYPPTKALTLPSFTTPLTNFDSILFNHTQAGHTDDFYHQVPHVLVGSCSSKPMPRTI